MTETTNLKNSSNFANSATFDESIRQHIVRSKIESYNEWIEQFRKELFPCFTVPNYRMVSRRRRYSLRCTSSICHGVGLYDFKFCKSFGPASDPVTRSCGFSVAKHSHLCWTKIAKSLSGGHGNAFSFIMNQTTILAINFGIRKTDKLSEVCVRKQVPLDGKESVSRREE